jgi:hypothetical protein
MIHGLCIAGQFPTGARAQESERGTEKRAMCDFAFHAAVLSARSVRLSCNSRAGSAEGELSEETARGEGGWLDGSLLLGSRRHGLLDGLEVASRHRLAMYYITKLRHDSDDGLQAVE